VEASSIRFWRILMASVLARLSILLTSLALLRYLECPSSITRTRRKASSVREQRGQDDVKGSC
jgi:hypothetical protein